MSMSLMNGVSPHIDLSNLFSMGCDVNWPANNRPGFLSYEHCPNLWALGARQTTPAAESYALIEQIITAVNACCLADPASLDDGIYIRAYKELTSYLRYLFVHYDKSLIESNAYNSEEIKKNLSWLLSAIENDEIENIDVISFNYDALLERSLAAQKIPFNIPALSEKKSKLSIHKLHGSITFCGKSPLDKTSFSINYSNGFTEGGIDDFEVRYDELDGHYTSIGILPPAGDSDRYSHRWIRQIWEKALASAENIADGDTVIIYGLSYWHVDRKEIDTLLGKVSRKARVISINPNPNPNLEAVCCSLFRSYHSYTTHHLLNRILK